MDYRKQIDDLDLQLHDLWHLGCAAKQRGDWHTYWRLRRSWLAVGRLHSLLIQRQAEERSGQLTLLEPGEGRRHDTDPAA